MRFVEGGGDSAIFWGYAIKPGCWSGNSSITTLVIVSRIAPGPQPPISLSILAYCLPTENYYLHCYTGLIPTMRNQVWWGEHDLPDGGDLRLMILPKKSRASVCNNKTKMCAQQSKSDKNCIEHFKYVDVYLGNMTPLI